MKPFAPLCHRVVTLLIVVTAASACRVRQDIRNPSELSTTAVDKGNLSQNEEIAAKLLVAHCKACHAVGEHRFLDLQDIPAMWRRLYTDRSSKSGAVWAEQIIKSLDWPNGVPPDSEQRYSKDFRYMPIGAQRGKLHASKVGNQSSRTFIIDTLQAGLARQVR